MNVIVEASDVGRYSQEAEAAVYFCVLEALQNVAKYAKVSTAKVHLRGGSGGVRFEVRDEGLRLRSRDHRRRNRRSGDARPSRGARRESVRELHPWSGNLGLRDATRLGMSRGSARCHADYSIAGILASHHHQ